MIGLRSNDCFVTRATMFTWWALHYPQYSVYRYCTTGSSKYCQPYQEGIKSLDIDHIDESYD